MRSQRIIYPAQSDGLSDENRSGRENVERRIASIVREVIKDTTATTDFTDDSHFVNDLTLD